MTIVDGIHIADFRRHGRNGEEGRAFKEDNLLRANLLRKRGQEPLDDGQVRDQSMHDPRPCFVQRLVPDTAPEGIDCEMAAPAADQRGSFFVDALAVFGLDQVEFVH